jgi:hypothetical protein
MVFIFLAGAPQKRIVEVLLDGCLLRAITNMPSKRQTWKCALVLLAGVAPPLRGNHDHPTIPPLCPAVVYDVPASYCAPCGAPLTCAPQCSCYAFCQPPALYCPAPNPYPCAAPSNGGLVSTPSRSQQSPFVAALPPAQFHANNSSIRYANPPISIAQAGPAPLSPAPRYGIAFATAQRRAAEPAMFNDGGRQLQATLAARPSGSDR